MGDQCKILYSSCLQDDTDTAEQDDTQLSQEDLIFEHAADTSNDENDIDEETMYVIGKSLL